MIDIKFINKEQVTKEQQEYYRKLLRNIVQDAKSLYDGYPSKHKTDLYKFTVELLKVL
jgi:hypothetical protein